MESLRPDQVDCFRKQVEKFQPGKIYTPILKVWVQCLSKEEIATSRMYTPEGGGPAVERPFSCNDEWFDSVEAMLAYFDVNLSSESQGDNRVVNLQDGAIRFAEVAARAGVGFRHNRDDAVINLGGGVAAGDFNNDGHLDIYVTNSAGANALFRNNGDGTFSDVAASAGVDDPVVQGYGAGWADFDNDGDLDLFVANFGSSKLFKNEGSEVFVDVTAESGVGDPEPDYRTTGVSWGDYDSDGFLDLFVVRHVVETDGRLPYDRAGLAKAVRPLALYHNSGNGSFNEVTRLLGDTTAYPSAARGAGFKPAFVDYDNDGDMDLYVVNDFGASNHPNVLWRNDGAGDDGEWLFKDVSRDSGADLSVFGMGLATGDYDNDGDLDFYITDIGDSEFLENQGDGTFVNVTGQTGTGRGAIPENWFDDKTVGWGTVFADLDNDGFLDLYYVAGQMDNQPCFNMENQPNAVFRNNGDGTFLDVSAGSGADDPGTGRGVAHGDFNGDGLTDLFLANLGRSQGPSGEARLFLNTSESANHWLDVKLIGTSSNRDGIGARVVATTGNLTLTREMGSSQSHTSHSVVPVHFGLGEATEVDVLEVRWPTGVSQILTDIRADQTILVIEP